MVAVLRAYAIVLGKKEMRLVDPLPALIPFYWVRFSGLILLDRSGKRHLVGGAYLMSDPSRLDARSGLAAHGAGGKPAARASVKLPTVADAKKRLEAARIMSLGVV